MASNEAPINLAPQTAKLTKIVKLGIKRTFCEDGRPCKRQKLTSPSPTDENDQSDWLSTMCGKRIEQAIQSTRPELHTALNKHPAIKTRRTALTRAVTDREAHGKRKIRELLLEAMADEDLDVDLYTDVESSPELIAPSMDIATPRIRAAKKKANRMHARWQILKTIEDAGEYDTFGPNPGHQGEYVYVPDEQLNPYDIFAGDRSLNAVISDLVPPPSQQQLPSARSQGTVGSRADNGADDTQSWLDNMVNGELPLPSLQQLGRGRTRLPIRLSARET